MNIHTERLILRRWKKEDLIPFYQMNSDPEVMEFLLKTLSKEESDELVKKIEEHFEEYGFGYWALEEKSTGNFVGLTGLMPFPVETHFTPAIQISWRLAKAYWGKGYASESALTAIRYGFDHLKLLEIVSITVPHNQKSRAVMERIGMKRCLEGDFGHPLVPDGHSLKKHVLYRIKK